MYVCMYDVFAGTCVILYVCIKQSHSDKRTYIYTHRDQSQLGEGDTAEDVREIMKKKFGWSFPILDYADGMDVFVCLCVCVFMCLCVYVFMCLFICPSSVFMYLSLLFYYDPTSPLIPSEWGRCDGAVQGAEGGQGHQHEQHGAEEDRLELRENTGRQGTYILFVDTVKVLLL
jgi:hypothetical protein